MKSVRFNFYSALAVVVILLLFSFIFLGFIKAVDSAIGIADNEISELRDQDDEIDDVEGYGIIFYGIGAIGGSLLNVFLSVIILFIGFYDLFLFLFLLSAKLIYKNGKRIIGYRILMGFAYAMMIGLFILLLPSAITSLLIFIFEIYLIIVIFLGIRNTYSKRIIENNIEQNIFNET